MVTVKVRKIANPRHRPRKMSAKQIRIFGTKRQKAALKAHRNRTKLNPPKRSSNARKANPRKRNTALVVTLGSALNPRKNKRRNTVAATAKKSNRRRRRYNVHHRRRNTRAVARNPRHRNRTAPARATNRRRRRYNTRHHRRNMSRKNPKIIVMKPNRRHRRRNPLNTELFGNPLFGKNSLELVGGGILGLVAAKFIPTLFPASITGGVASSSIGRVVISGISAVVGAWAGSKVSPLIGQGMLFGGMIQTMSIALNAFLPNVYSQLNPTLGRLGRFGDLTPGAFTIPQNPILLGRGTATLPPAAAQVGSGGGQVRMTTNGLGRAYGTAY